MMKMPSIAPWLIILMFLLVIVGAFFAVHSDKKFHEQCESKGGVVIIGADKRVCVKSGGLIYIG